MLYLHSDQLGSVSAATNAGGALVSKQDFGPWGTIRSGGISQTTVNFTGQRRDGTGLLYYNARYYDPSLARFVSADSVVPGAADGSLDGVSLKTLTVALGEADLTAGVNQENRQPFWFQMNDQQRQQANAPWGPAQPQALNRYAYVQNNPVRFTDPTGHSVYLTSQEAKEFVARLRSAAKWLREGSSDLNYAAATMATFGVILGGLGLTTAGVGAILGAVAEAIAAGGWLASALLGKGADSFDTFADLVEQNTGKTGVIVGNECNVLWCYISIINRDTGNGNVLRDSSFYYSGLGEVFRPGRACKLDGHDAGPGNYWRRDYSSCVPG